MGILSFQRPNKSSVRRSEMRSMYQGRLGIGRSGTQNLSKLRCFYLRYGEGQRHIPGLDSSLNNRRSITLYHGSCQTMSKSSCSPNKSLLMGRTETPKGDAEREVASGRKQEIYGILLVGLVAHCPSRSPLFPVLRFFPIFTMSFHFSSGK